MSARLTDGESGIGRAPAGKLHDRRGAESRLAPLRVFLVEDSPLLRDTVTRAITNPGRIEVVGHADSESSAVEGVNRCLPDVVIVDICLRDGSNGMNVLRSISQMVWLRLPVLIVLTNHPFPEYSQACRKLGADYFFDKTTEFEEVGYLLETMSGQKRASVDYM